MTLSLRIDRYQASVCFIFTAAVVIPESRQQKNGDSKI